MMTGLVLKFLMIYLGVQPVYAATNLLSEGPGAEAATFGRSAVSIVQDPTSLYWNPAGLTGAGGAVTGEHEFLYDGARYDFVGLSVPSRYGSFGLGALQLYRGDIIARSAIDDPGYTVSASQADYMAGYAKTLGEHWSAGTTINVLDTNLAGFHDRGVGVDAGGRYTAAPDSLLGLSRPQLTAGAVIKNLVAPSLKLDQDQEILPRELRGGVSLSFDGLSRLSLAAGSIHKDRAMVGVGFSRSLGDTELRFGLGASYTLQDVLTLRLGIDDGFAVGVGLKTADGRFSVDYALEDRPLTQNHRFTLTYRFLKSAKEATVSPTETPDGEYLRAKAHAESLADEAFTHGRELFKAGRYDEADESFAMAALLKPEDPEVQAMRKRSAEVRRREAIQALRRELDKREAAGDAPNTYRVLAALLRYVPEDKERLIEEARHLSERLDQASRAAVEAEIVSVSTSDIESESSRGLDAVAIADVAWLESVATSSPTAAVAHELGERVRSSARARRSAFETGLAQARAAGGLGKAVVIARAEVRAYPDDAAATQALHAAEADYGPTVHLTAKDRIYVRKLYDLAAIAWYRRDAERARDLLEELRRYDADDAAAAALMDAMADAGAVHETFANNGGGH